MPVIEFEKHAPTSNFGVEDNVLTIGGQKITDLYERAGGVPLYIYDSALFARRAAELRTLFDGHIDLHYAMKANPMPELVRFAADHVDGLDVASGLELDVALTSKCPVDEISFAGPGKTPDELAKAIDAGITLNVESKVELARIASIASEKQRTANVALRVNPDFQLKTSGMKMGGGAQQFGIDAEQIPDILDGWRNGTSPFNTEYLQFVGFHIYSGSQNLQASALQESQEKTVELAARLAQHAPSPVRALNIGGGFGIPYFPGEKPLDTAPLKTHIVELAATAREKMPDAKLIIELGRYLVGECGIYVCEVTDKKISRDQTFLIANGGLHHHLAASGNFGQIIRKNYPVLVGNRVTSDDNERASVVGPLCTPLDLLADKMTMSRAEIGDLIVVFQSGAYGYTASPRDFLSHPAPKQLLV
ncbi:MAG: pyridoxal-dependent decarboxylase, exosortase A system-associated [Gammaproteobacteria bacterium]